jgi:hypothetical protein
MVVLSIAVYPLHAYSLARIVVALVAMLIFILLSKGFLTKYTY